MDMKLDIIEDKDGTPLIYLPPNIIQPANIIQIEIIEIDITSIWDKLKDNLDKKFKEDINAD